MACLWSISRWTHLISCSTTAYDVRSSFVIVNAFLFDLEFSFVLSSLTVDHLLELILRNTIRKWLAWSMSNNQKDASCLIVNVRDLYLSVDIYES
jgi:hypothetical protein